MIRRAGDVLFEGGKPSADAYILCDGAVEIVKDSGRGVQGLSLNLKPVFSNNYKTFYRFIRCFERMK